MKLKYLPAVCFCLLPLFIRSQNVEMVKFPYVESLLKNTSDTTFILNFWATWCKPCVKEIPDLEKLNEKYSGKKIKIVLVSLDFKRQFETDLIPFVNKNKIKSTVVLLDEPDYNSWIDKVDKTWGGAIPVTVVLNNHKKFRQFFQKEIIFEELEKTIKPLIN